MTWRPVSPPPPHDSTSRDGLAKDAAARVQAAPLVAAPVPLLEIVRDAPLDVGDALREQRTVTDEDLDALYPEWVRARSWRYWTPVDVARRAAELLVTGPATRVLDVGSGAGKFCLVGALSTEGHFTGVEQREHLVEVARATARRCGATRALYVHGDLREVDWRRFDAFYFFNPFAENYFGDDRLDSSVELTPERYERDLRFVLAALDDLPVGTRAVTYHGLGRSLPPSYQRLGCELAGTDVLELWVKVPP
jgi:SAM-dependent methyltransferase